MSSLPSRVTASTNCCQTLPKRCHSQGRESSLAPLVFLDSKLLLSMPVLRQITHATLGADGYICVLRPTNPLSVRLRP
jgi:hypothetical protein